MVLYKDAGDSVLSIKRTIMSDTTNWNLFDNEIEDAIIIKDKKNRDGEGEGEGGDGSGGGSGSIAYPRQPYNAESLFANAMSYQEVRGALDKAEGRMTYIPRASEQKVDELMNIALARQAELGLGLDAGVSPTPYGRSSPMMGLSIESKEDYLTNPNVHPVHGRIPAGMNHVILDSNFMDAYITNGTINGKDVTFLVDTGASDVSIPKRIANYIGLKANGPSINASTAGGTIRIQKTLLDMLTIGNICLTHVSASINPLDKSDKILLGMSALKRLEFTDIEGKLILRQKHFT